MHFSIDHRIRRAGEWFTRKNDRPLFGFYLGSQYPLHRFPRGSAALPTGEVHASEVQVGPFLDDFDDLYRLYDDAGGELIWSAAPFFGLPWVEASLGCRVLADHAVGSTRTEPPPGLTDGLSFEIPAFSPENPWVQSMLAFIEPALERSGGRYPIGVTLLRGISDVLAAVYGGADFVLAAIEEPKRVREQALKVADYWITMADHLLQRTPSFHGGTGSFFYSLWCPGPTIWMQEDAAALLSPSVFGSVLEPAVRRAVSAFPRSVMHLHPTRFLPTEQVLAAGVSVVEVHRDVGGPTARELSATHNRVLRQCPLFVWGDLTREDILEILDERPYQGLAISVVVADAGQAAEIWDLYQETCNRRLARGPSPERRSNGTST